MLKDSIRSDHAFQNQNDGNNPLPKRKDDISMRNFRPTIEVDGCPAWDEDIWVELRIGEAHLEVSASCARFVLTTVDPVKGEMTKKTSS
ncbi:hypothetical protein GCK72_019080 [Caenorhabditis remanei]|uniref:MOSC domain-containing protein n=1 Tax=Caenorhabditis remanei TaxID=31234 RepID=A0A6A5GD18_CAERE|nr:hypothetical protein GCK72_019080 [Caenorhabditis remanei]KAF1752525.1 hypothetical protein GCK72_019080 [Caenorhabditis remanei]